jgi:anaphase-promoting complex subunit 3
MAGRYGLGNIYYRQEKYDFAEHHLRKALAINPCSSPLYCYLGMALHANAKTAQALEMLSNAISIDPKNPLARFQKAQVLLSTEAHEAALLELTSLLEMAPKEGSVYFVLGKARCRHPFTPSLLCPLPPPLYVIPVSHPL